MIMESLKITNVLQNTHSFNIMLGAVVSNAE